MAFRLLWTEWLSSQQTESWVLDGYDSHTTDIFRNGGEIEM